MKTEIDMIVIRKKRGWTQANLAEYLGVDRTTVSRIEAGKEASKPIKKLLEFLVQEDSVIVEEKSNA